MVSWDSALIDKIRANKVKEQSEDRDNLLQLVSKQLYGETVHYALELIQNAEDVESKTIKFIFNKDAIVVINDGYKFDQKDVEGICSVFPSS